MITDKEIEFALEQALRHIANDWVKKNILNYKDYGHKSAIEGAKKALGTGGFSFPNNISALWDRKGILVYRLRRDGGVLVPHSRLVELVQQREGIGQGKLF